MKNGKREESMQWTNP